MLAPQHKTPYAETEALLAVLEDDRNRAVEIAAGMSVREQGEFQQALRRLIQIVDETAPDLSVGRRRPSNGYRA